MHPKRADIPDFLSPIFLISLLVVIRSLPGEAHLNWPIAVERQLHNSNAEEHRQSIAKTVRKDDAADIYEAPVARDDESWR